MKVLIACEESQEVCKAFRQRGHEAYSCDVQEPSGGHPEWHIHDDVTPLLNGHCEFCTMDCNAHNIKSKWDIIIAFPPCTHLALSGAPSFAAKRNSGIQEDAIEFFAEIWHADCEKICIENPRNIMSGKYISEHFPDLAIKWQLPLKKTQEVQPWQFGDPYQKTTWLWLKGLQPLVPTVVEKPELEFYTWEKNGKTKRYPKWLADAFFGKCDRSRIRSKTFPGIAAAMAEQWG